MTLIDYLSSLQDNPYFGAGFGLVGVGAGVAALRKVSMIGMMLFRRHYMMTLEVPCRDKSYQWLLQWITLKSKHTQHISVETNFKQLDTGKFLTSFDFVPSVGTHFFYYKKTWIKVERNREQHTLDLHMGVPWETVTLTALGRNKSLYFQILDEARNMALKREEGKTIIYTAMGSEWRQFGHPKKRRPLNSVILDEGISEDLFSDIKEFLNSSHWYTERGIPYRRGYLLYGPAGAGKTSFITALAGELEYSICVLNLSDRGLSDDRLQYLMSVTPQQSLILLEDIDAACTNVEEAGSNKTAYEGLNRVSFSGLLNMMDGAVSSEGRILFMTTNYFDRLQPALIRPGRVDVKKYIGFATDYQLKQMYQRFYPEMPSSASEEFATSLRKICETISMAKLQGFFMYYKNDPKRMLENINQIKEL